MAGVGSRVPVPTMAMKQMSQTRFVPKIEVDVGVVQRRQGLDLTLEPPQPLLVVSQLLRQDLDRHLTLEPSARAGPARKAPPLYGGAQR